MNSVQYLDAARRTLKLPSDYALAAKFEVDRREIGEIRRGRKPLSLYLCMKIAIVLHEDPATVIADIQSQTDKNPVRAQFWQSFLCAARRKAALCILVATYTVSSLIGLSAPGGPFDGLAGPLLRRRQFG